MKRFKRLVRDAILLFLFCLFFGAFATVIIFDSANKPVVYRSASTNEIVRVEIHGKIVPNQMRGKRYHHEWVP